MNRRLCALFLPLVFSFAGCDTLMFYSEEDMNAMGAKAYVEETGKHKVITGTADAAMVQRVGEKIAKACGRDDYQWEFKLLDAPDTINAFALPGGKIAVYSGLLKVTQNEDALAAVMGHEVAHATEQHGNKRMSQQTVAGVGLGAAQLILDHWEDGSNETKGLVLGGLGLAVDGAVLKPYSRSHESEADAVGLEFMMRAGYNPEEAPKLWERMAKLSGGEASFIDRFLATHPDSLERAAELRRLIPVVREKLAAEGR